MKVKFLHIVALCVLCILFSSCSRNPLELSHRWNMIASNGNGRTVVCGQDGLFAVATGKSGWEIHATNEAIDYVDLEYVADRFFLLGYDTHLQRNVLFVLSEKGSELQPQNISVNIIQIMSANDTLFLLSDENVLYTLTEAGVKRLQDNDATLSRDTPWRIPQDMVYDGTRYMLTGGGNFVLASSDMEKWAVVEHGEAGSNCSLSACTNGVSTVFTGDHFYLASLDQGQSTLSILNPATSLDEANQDVDFHTRCLYDSASNGDGFVVVGSHGTILGSKDVRRWAFRESKTFATLRVIVWDGQQYVVLGNTADESSVILYSRDGDKWDVIAE